MDTGIKTYNVDKHKQLIPLNGSTVNFTCFFEVKNKDKKPFQVAIVEQGELKPKQYKAAENGYINGQIESDGQLKTYFLVLRAQEEPCECSVRIVLKPKGTNEPQHPTNIEQGDSNPSPPPQGTQIHPNGHPNHHPNPPSVVVQPKESYFQMKYIVGISVTIIIVYLLYKYRKTIFDRFSVDNTSNLAPSMSNTSF